MRAHDQSGQHPSGQHPSGRLPGAEPDAGTADNRPNRAARRGKHASTVASRGRGAAPHARGAQGRRINPVRRTG
jgi:hypothetical protein